MHSRELTPHEQRLYGKMRLRAASGLGFPYFAAALWRMKPRAIDRVPVKIMGEPDDTGRFVIITPDGIEEVPEDGKIVGCLGAPCALDMHGRVYFDFKAVEEWGNELSSHVLGKLLNHWFRHHGKRAEGHSDRGAWLQAAAWEVNDDFGKEFKLLPAEVDGTANEFSAELQAAAGMLGVDPKEFADKPLPVDGRTAEEYYEFLEQLSEGAPKPQSGKGSDPASGSGIGKPEDFEEPADSEESPAMSQVAQDGLRQQTAQSIVDHESKARGTVPRDLLRQAEKILKPPRIPWERQLRSAIRNAVNYASGMDDFTYRKPSRRYPDEDRIIFPSMHSPQPRVACVVDTSGSMSETDLGHALAQVDRLCKQLNTPLTVVSADAGEGEVQQVTSISQVKLKGGGGTDLTLASNQVMRLCRPDVLIWLTDGYTPYHQDLSEIGRTQWIVGVIARSEDQARRAAWRAPSFAKVVPIAAETS